MSSNKTQAPGMENYGMSSQSFNGLDLEENFSNSGKRKTKFPGMENNAGSGNEQGNQDPIVGFLFSVSRTPFGEYWPLYLGKNFVGRDKSNTIYLPENSVSNEHALLAIEQSVNPTETVAILENRGSKYGTFVNGKQVIYGRTAECKNGDVVRFGSSYECLVILFDVRNIGLKKAENFSPVENYDPFDNDNDNPYCRDYSRKDTSGGMIPNGAGTIY